jgi:S-layer protein (TIGR01567 family)
MRYILFFAVLFLFLINSSYAMELRGPIVSTEGGQIELNGSNFPGFYYSAPTTSYEKLTMIFSSNGSVNAEKATYTLTVSSGRTALLGKRYQSLNHLNSPLNMPTLLSEVWFPSKSILGINQSLVLSEGYEIVLKDVMGREGGKEQARLELRKDGKAVVESAVAPGDYFEYSKNIKGSNYTLITSKVDWVFSGNSSNESIKPAYNASIVSITQYSENPLEIKVGDKYGEFEVKSITNKSIILKNTAAIALPLDSKVSILDGFIKFMTAKDVYRAYAINSSEEAKSYELRGTPVNPPKDGYSFKWSADNFGGLFYDPEYNASTEWLSVTIDKTNKQIAEGDLVYESTPVKIPYRNPEMASFSESYFKDRLPVIGWQGERYAAIGSAGRLSRILLDSVDEKTLHIGELWDLGEGYTLKVKEIGAEDRAVLISLAKNGNEVYSGIIEPGSSADLGTHTFLYTKKINGVLAPVFSVYVEAVFGKDMAQFRYPLMISDSPLEMNPGDTFGNVTVVSNSEKLRLENEQEVPVYYGTNVDATGDVWFKVASSTTTVSFYPLITKIQQGESYISTSPLPEVPAEEYLMGEI